MSTASDGKSTRNPYFSAAGIVLPDSHRSSAYHRTTDGIVSGKKKEKKASGVYAFFALVFLSPAAAFAFADAFFAAATALVIFTDVVITSFWLMVVYATW